MKKSFNQAAKISMATIFACLWTMASAQVMTNSFTFNENQAVPDGDLSGISFTENLSGMGDLMTGLTISLDISGGFNGDLYAYLRGPDGGFSVLLNNVGVSNNASMFGYSDSGLNVTFSDAAAYDIHYYQKVANYSSLINGGTWQPDGINIDPLSSPSAFGSAPQSAMLSSFDNTNPNGAWTLFLADVSSGPQSTLDVWNLNIITAPEPSTLALTGIGSLLVAWRLSRRG